MVVLLLKMGVTIYSIYAKHLQIVTRDTRSLFLFTKGKAQDWHFKTQPLTIQHHWILHLSLSPPNIFRSMDLLQEIDETAAICTAHISLKTALTSPSEYQVNKTYLRIYLSMVFSVQSQILHPTHAVLRQISLSALKVSSFSKHLPSSDYNIQDPSQIPHLYETLFSVCYLFLHWEYKNTDW